MPTPEPEEVETVRQIVGALLLSEVQAKIEALSQPTWDALQIDLPLWDEYRFDNETKFKLGELSSEVDPVKTRIDYRNSFCLILGYPLFNMDGSRGTQSTINPYLTPSRVVRNKVCF